MEREYLAALSDAVPLADWQAVVARALADAKAGDAKARDWLARYLIGSIPINLTDIAADEAAGIGAELDIAKSERERTVERLLLPSK